jgi:lysozyme family protein
MGLSRKRQRELNRLKRQAEDLLRDQREVLEHASQVVRNASHQASNFASEEVGPRVKDAFDDRVRPVLRSGAKAAKSGRDRFVDDVLPTLSGALASAMAVIESAKNSEVSDKLVKAGRSAKDAGVKAGVRAGIIEAPKSSGPGKYILLGVALVAVAGVAYAAWQTLRADDSLWVEDEPEGDEA